MTITTSEMPKVVLFLGAGFSKGISPQFPLTKHFYRRIKTGLSKSDPKYLLALSELEKIVRRKKRENNQKIEQMFEEILGELWGNKDQFYAGVHSMTLYRALVNGVGILTRYKSKRYCRYEDKRTGLGKYLDLIRTMKKTCRISIVTTNYDLISDKTSQFLNYEQLGFHPCEDPPLDSEGFQYGFGFRGVWSGSGEGKDNGGYPRNWKLNTDLIQLYKIHGSANWAYCRKCDTLDLSQYYTDFEKMFSMEDSPECVECGIPYEKLIVPPLPNKGDLKNKYLEKVWAGAETCLKEADYVLFIGYSLPSADPLIIDLIIKSMGDSKKYFLMERSEVVVKRYTEKLGNPIESFTSGYSRSNVLQVLNRINSKT